ncbi:MAG: hypothetical protein ACSW8J_01185, partial [bacterium]
MPRREWTVVFYLCGSVLESRHGCATENLREIASCYMYAVSRNLLMIGRTETPDPGYLPGAVRAEVCEKCAQKEFCWER